MSTVTKLAVALAAVAIVGLSARAAGQCPAITFENLANGTIVTTQYEGVTFSVQPQSCGGSPQLYLRIATPAGGTSSGTKALQIDTGCPDFSPDYLRMMFSDLQQMVTFTVGEPMGNSGFDYQVRYYGDGGLLGSKMVESGGGISTWVTVGSVTGPVNIRRIEVDSPIDYFEVIDDLTFIVDTTPPQALITAPAYESCVCGSIQVRGTACDPDGAYDFDQLEYLRVDAPAGTPWTLIGSYTSPACADDALLYTWNASGVPHGYYYLRLTVANECGMSATAVTVAYVDKLFNSLDVRFPNDGDVVGGKVPVDGTAWDDHCFDHYTVEKRTGAGAYTPVDPAHAQYAVGVITDPVGVWDTAFIPSGDFDIRVTATDQCGNLATTTRTVTVDNFYPTAIITSPLSCAYVEGSVDVYGTAYDANLLMWKLYYSDPATIGGWHFIDGGSTSVVNGLLGTWDTTGLPACAYTLRLVVTDASIRDGDPAIHLQHEDVVSVHAGEFCPVDLDGDTDEDLADYAMFQNCFGNP